MLKRHPANPLITPEDVRPSHPDFEVVGVFNAGATIVRGKTVLVLRVAERPRTGTRATVVIPHVVLTRGKPRLILKRISRTDRRYNFSDPRVVTSAGVPGRTVRFLTSISHLRLAWSDDGIRFRVEPRPWLFPAVPEEAWGCEDARVTKIGNTSWVNYTAVSDRGISTALASTQSFRVARRHGVIFAPANRDVTIFPEKIGGSYAAHHRPMPTYIGEDSIWYAESPDLLHWGRHRFVAGPRPGLWDGWKIGGGAPPIRTKNGWLSIYHGVDRKTRYRLGGLLTDLKEPWRVLARSRQPLLEPTAPYERRGFFPNVCFTCGAVVRNGNLWVYYGAGDRSMALATVPLRVVLQALDKNRA